MKVYEEGVKVKALTFRDIKVGQIFKYIRNDGNIYYYIKLNNNVKDNVLCLGSPTNLDFFGLDTPINYGYLEVVKGKVILENE